MIWEPSADGAGPGAVSQVWGGSPRLRPGRCAAGVKASCPAAIAARPALSSARLRGRTVTNRPCCPSIQVMVAVTASLLSATYKNPGYPAMARHCCQVPTWVVSSVMFPSAIRMVNGTAPSAVTVMISSSCFRSGRWSLECPRAGRAAAARAAPPAAAPASLARG